MKTISEVFLFIGGIINGSPSQGIEGTGDLWYDHPGFGDGCRWVCLAARSAYKIPPNKGLKHEEYWKLNQDFLGRISMIGGWDWFGERQIARMNLDPPNFKLLGILLRSGDEDQIVADLNEMIWAAVTCLTRSYVVAESQVYLVAISYKLTPLCNPTAGSRVRSRVPRFHSGLQGRQKTRHHSQTQRSKPKSLCCSEQHIGGVTSQTPGI